MYVPNYVPEPIEVPGAVADQPYRTRVRFLRRVSALHVVSIALISILTRIPWPTADYRFPLVALVVLLVGLDLPRIFWRGKPLETYTAAAGLVLVLPCAAWTCASLQRLGFPTWPLAVGPVASLIYSILCGRDYSFVGAFLLSLIASIAFIAAVCGQYALTTSMAVWSFLANLVYLFYVLYDLASIQSRRRVGEELAAVTDLYRDVFNVFGYVPRVVRHWRRHRIWSIAR